MSALTTDPRIEQPPKVLSWSEHAAVTIGRNGQWRKMAPRYFPTKEEALEFCGGKESKVIYAPGEAFYRSNFRTS